MTTIVTRAGKGSPLTWNEVDNNFTNLNSAKYESGNNATFGTISGTTITASSAFSGALNGTVGATTPASGSFTSLTDSGNLTFTGTGNRITGDFSNATASNRVWYQTSTANTSTIFDVVPNGSGVASRTHYYNSSDPANASVFQVGIRSGGAESALVSTLAGTGTYLPMTFYTGGSERMRINTSGNVGIGENNAGTYGKFGVAGTSYQASYVRSTDASGAIAILAANSSTEVRIGAVSNHPLWLITNNLERMRIDSSGNVGIGTSSPSNLLQVSKAGSDSIITTGNTYPISIYSNDGSADAAIYWKGSAGALRFGTTTDGKSASGFTERMRIDSSGNVGIGTTSMAGKLNVTGSAAGISGYFTDAVNSSLVIRNLSGGVTLGTDAGGAIHLASNGNTASDRKLTVDPSGNVGIGTSSPTTKLQINAQDGFRFDVGSSAKSYMRFGSANTGESTAELSYTRATGATAISVGSTGSTLTDRLIIDSSGNVGIGTSSPSTKFQVAGTSGSPQFQAGTASNGYFQINAFDSNPVYCVVAGTNATAGVFGTQSNIPTIFCTNNTERMRIDSSGNVLINTTSTGVASGGFLMNGGNGSDSYIGIGHSSSGVSGNYYAAFRFNGTPIGTITQNGTTAVAYNTSSDYRLKENIAPMTGALDKVALLKPVTYTWKIDGSAGQGFIAHELQEVVPDCVTGEKDAVDAEGNPVYQGIDTSFLVATLTAAIQEQQEIIKQLQIDVATLKGN